MKINLLVVDDVKENLYALEVLLEELEVSHEDYNGLNIFTALSGEECLKIVLKQNIDLILLDIRMPEMDGFEVAHFLKSSKKTAHIPIVFLTAEFKSEEFIEKGYKVGALDYFTKPIEKFQFLNKMTLYIDLFLSKKIQKKEFDDTLLTYMELMDKHIISSDTDLTGKITRVTDAFCEISGYGKEELMGQNHKILRHEDTSFDLYQNLWKTITEDNIWKGQIKNKNKSGEDYWIEILISPKFDKKQTKIGYTAIMHDITSKKRLEIISITDPLTGLYNRRHFNFIASNLIQNDLEDNFLCFALIDIDCFKKYNDTYGHVAGDGALERVSNVFKNFIKRDSDYCFRLGGEEFCIVFVSKCEKKAYDFIVKIKKEVESLKIEHKKNSASKYLTISVGFNCKKTKDIKSLENLYNETDELLYEAKESGRNRVVSI